jgi:hypothetical protein
MRTLHRLYRDPISYYLSNEMSTRSVHLPILSRSCKDFGPASRRDWGCSSAGRRRSAKAGMGFVDKFAPAQK